MSEHINQFISDSLFGAVMMGLFLKTRKHCLSKLFLTHRMTATTKILMNYERRSALKQRYNYWSAFFKYTCLNAFLLSAGELYFYIGSAQQPFQHVSLARQLIKPILFCSIFKLPLPFGAVLGLSGTAILKLIRDELSELL